MHFRQIGSAVRLCSHRPVRRATTLTVLAAISLLGASAVLGQPAVADPADPVTTDERSPNDNCPLGFKLILSSGVSCVQDRDTLPENGSISYTGTSICLEGEATFETRETIDGLPAPGTGDRTEFPFLLSCDPAAASSDEDDADSSDGASEVGDDVVTDGFGNEQRRVIIGLGAGGAGLVVTVGVARALMRRWKMTPKQLLGADLRAPAGVGDGPSTYEESVEIGPEGEGGYDEVDTAPPLAAVTSDPDLVHRSGGGVIHDTASGRWIDWSPGPDGKPVVTGGGGPEVGATAQRFQSYSAQDAPAAGAAPPVAEGFSISLDPSGGLAATLSTGQPGGRYHATVRQSRRGRTLDLGLRPTDRTQLRYRAGTGDSDMSFNWKFDSNNQLGITHETGIVRRTLVRHTVRF